MALSKTHGFCIRRTDFSETSQIVTFYTRDFGRVGLIAKGAKRKNSPTEGRIDLFATGELVIVRKRSGALNVLAQFKPEDLLEGLRADLRRAYTAFYVAELLDRSQHEEEAHPKFYDVCLATLRQLACGRQPDMLRMVFEARLLDSLGVARQMKECVECGEGVSERGKVAFSAGRGGVLCRNCAPQDAWWVPVGALGVVDGLRRTSPTAAERITIPPKLAGFVRDVLRQSIVHALDREPRLMRLL